MFRSDESVESEDCFLLVREGRPVGIFEANVVDDDCSEKGWCFDYYVSKLSSDGAFWYEVDGGQYWDYETSADLLIDVLEYLSWEVDAAVVLSRGELDDVAADPKIAFDLSQMVAAIETVG